MRAKQYRFHLIIPPLNKNNFEKAGGSEVAAQYPIHFLQGDPIGLPLRALREHRRPTGYPSPTYTGRGARTVGLLTDRTCLFKTSMFLPPP
jgi:hypothetical protein